MNKPQGLSSSQLKLIENSLREVLKPKKKYAISVFGSRARGGFRQYSDLDLWIESDPELSREEESEIRGLIEESDLPIKVDIVTPQTCLEAYREEILSEKKIWFSTETHPKL